MLRYTVRSSEPSRKVRVYEGFAPLCLPKQLSDDRRVALVWSEGDTDLWIVEPPIGLMMLKEFYRVEHELDVTITLLREVKDEK